MPDPNFSLISDPDPGSRRLKITGSGIRITAAEFSFLPSKMPSLLLRTAAVEKEQADPAVQHGPTQFRHGRLQAQISGAYTDKKNFKIYCNLPLFTLSSKT